VCVTDQCIGVYLRTYICIYIRIYTYIYIHHCMDTDIYAGMFACACGELSWCESVGK